MKIKCRIFGCGEPNKNGLVYPKNVVEDFVKDYNERVIQKNGFGLGELGHDGNDINEYLQLANVSHRCDKLYLDNNELVFEGDILKTPMGKMAKQIGIERLGPAIIGIGEVHNNNVTSFKLSHIDLVNKSECAWENASITEIEE